MSFLSFQNLTKRFPGVLALDGVSFEVERGSCHALIGENGAGKSTLGKILAGIHQADSGGILLEGHPIRPTDPLAARQLDIAMVHQELAFCPNLSVAENLCLGSLPHRNGWLDRSQMQSKARAMLQEIGADIRGEDPMENLSTAQEQMVQIAGAVGTGARIIIMDEPTSSLSLRESEKLFSLIKNLRRRGITILYVSHRMEEIFQLCDRLTVLRDGHHIATENVPETNQGRVIQQMIGREIQQHAQRHLAQPLGAEALRVEKLSSTSHFSNIHFSLRAGEVLGLAGLVGAGRSELAQAIFGLDPLVTGQARVCGEELPLGSTSAALKMGIGLVPEDRKKMGLVLSMNCRENTSLAALEHLTQFGFVQRRKEISLVQQHTGRLRVKAPSFETPIASLSGGNQQKISLAKWLARQCKILIVDEPTRGIDVGAKAEIHDLLDELACQGLALLVISSELPELMTLCRRILVMHEGQLAGELDRKDFSQASLMRMMAGITVNA